MTQKYYHNDYKKIMGVDQTRTASEKLLDRAIGGFRNKVQVKQEKVPEKKIKEEHQSLTHLQVLDKLIKNIQTNNQANKLIKTLNILKKCINDQSFIADVQINQYVQWKRIVEGLIQIDDRIVGHYSEVGLVIDCLVQIFGGLMQPLNRVSKDAGKSWEGKEEGERSKEEEEVRDIWKDWGELKQLIEICQLHLQFCKMHTDDSFAFNKLLIQFKRRFFKHFQDKLNSSSTDQTYIHSYLPKLLMKLFHLPHTKYDWIKQSLTQFFKQFNIQFKHSLPEAHLNHYLKTYNQFISHRGIQKQQNEHSNIFGNGGKSGKIISYQISAADGFDKWTEKQ